MNTALFTSRTSSRMRAMFLTLSITVSAVAATGASAQTQVPAEMRSEARSVATACRADYDRLCQGITPGGGRVLTCLTSKESQLSTRCKAAMPAAQNLASKATATGNMPK